MQSRTPEATDRPVFVDPSGRRRRTLRGIGWVVGGLWAGCAVTLAIGLADADPRAPRLTIPAEGHPVQPAPSPGTTGGGG
ncbi:MULTISPECIES: hypothetical protein [unclassified Streptomyces]|uniref:hypothetical protein n=1 Tax=unclassified Streptomyces TaxID=2593676 RepID=UPI00381E84AE